LRLTLFTRARIIRVAMQLRTARKRRHYTQAALAREAGAEQTTISKLENGLIHDPSYRLVTRICRVLHVDPESIDEFRVGATS
jgi:transcriptional regulator with XRE-family HTH domain